MDTTTEHGGGEEQAGGPFVSECCEGERCMCGQPAVRKIAEVVFHDDPLPGRHELTAYVCADHFIMVMGKRTGLETLASRPAQTAAPHPSADGGGGGERCEATKHAVELEQCSLFVDSPPLARAMTDAAVFLRALASRTPAPGSAGVAEELSAAQLIERDRSKLADGLAKLWQVLDSREWLGEGRGPYEWDDDRYRDEFTATAAEIRQAVQGLHEVARDWTGCPKTSAEIAAARGAGA